MGLLAILLCMFAAMLLLAPQISAPSIETLDRLAQAHEVEALSKYLAQPPTSGHNPFSIIRTKGAYDVGRFGWHALPLKGTDKANYVVFSTPLTSEDTGVLVFERVGDRLKFVPETRDFGIRLMRHDFDLKFEIPSKKAHIVDRLHLANADGTSGSFLFRMSPQYIVSSITDHANLAVPFTETGGVVSTIKPAKEDTYTIAYSALVDLPNYAGSIGEKEATLTNDYWYPMVARQPVPYDLTIHAPKKWIAVGQGDLIEESDTATEHIARYKMDLPCVYYSVAAGPFKKVSKTINGKIYSCWSSLLNQSQMEAQTEFYAPIIEFYQRFCPFPFKGYGAVDSAVYGGGALEAYSFTTWGHGSLPSEDAHEPSHTWWGGVINNTYLTSFWNESFAVFSDGMYHRGAAIGNADERKLAFIRDGSGNDSYNIVPIAQSGADVGGIGSSLGYGKGSQVLQMLEQLLGPEKMLATMKGWIEKCHGTDSDWPEYEKIVAAQNPDKDIKSFFDDWIRKPGYADLRVSDVKFLGDHITLNIGFNGPSFRVPLEVMVQFADGSRTFTTFDIRKPISISVPSPKKPVLVSVDPWRRVLRKIEPNETPIELNNLIRTLRRYSDPEHRDYLSEYGGENANDGAPADPSNTFIVGNPNTMPILRELCEKVGFRVDGNSLTYDGTTIDLNHGCAMAVVDLGAGRRCVIGLGKTRVGPDVGRARLALTDDLGRFLRGKTDPKTGGNLTFKL